jgi:hypothetical protein
MTDTLTTGAVATAATTAAVAALGQAEEGNAVAPLNAVSHILWGDAAARVDRADARHTLTGVALNAAAVTGWAGIHELLLPPRERRRLDQALLAGAAVSALAYVTDYHVVPKRFTPGFEKRLSGRSLLAIYATLALSLAAGSLLRSGDAEGNYVLAPIEQ